MEKQEPKRLKEVKLKRVKNLRAHIAIQIPGLTVTSLDADKHKVEMEVWPMGVKITKGNITKVITYANIQEFELYTEEV